METCLAETAIILGRVGGLPVPFLHLTVNRPALACLGSQKTGWVPWPQARRGHSRKSLKRPTGRSATATDTLPGEEVTDFIAGECGIDPRGLYVLVAPKRSLAGSIQVSGRVITAPSPDYGRPFARVLEGAGYDFLKVDPLLAFSPAEVTINDPESGEVYHFGRLNARVLLESFGGD